MGTEKRSPLPSSFSSASRIAAAAYRGSSARAGVGLSTGPRAGQCPPVGHRNLLARPLLSAALLVRTTGSNRKSPRHRIRKKVRTGKVHVTTGSNRIRKNSSRPTMPSRRASSCKRLTRRTRKANEEAVQAGVPHNACAATRPGRGPPLEVVEVVGPYQSIRPLRNRKTSSRSRSTNRCRTCKEARHQLG